MDIHADVQYSEYLEEIQRITGPLSRYQLDQLKELIYRIESRCAIGRENLSQLTHQQRDYSATEHNDETKSRVHSSNLSITESKSGICNSAVVVDEYLQQPIIIPRLDLSCLLDDESTEKPSSSWDIPVWSMSERLNNIKSVEKTYHETKNGMSCTCSSAVVVNEPIIIPKLDLSCLLDDEPSSSFDISVRSPSACSSNNQSIIRPDIAKLDLNILSERQEDNDTKEDISVDTGYSHGKSYGNNKNHYFDKDLSHKKVKATAKTHYETKNGMSYTCNSAVVVNNEYIQTPIIIPRLDLSYLLDDESTEKPSNSWDISVRSPSARSNNVKSIIKPDTEKLDLNILSERQEDNNTKEDVSFDTGYSHGKPYGKKNPEDNDMKEDAFLDTLYSQYVPRKYNHVYYKPRTMKKCDAQPYDKNKNHYFNKYLAYKKEKAIAATHHETRETRDRKCCTRLLPVYCQDGAVKPDPHKQKEVFVNQLLTILDNSEIHL